MNHDDNALVHPLDSDATNYESTLPISERNAQDDPSTHQIETRLHNNDNDETSTGLLQRETSPLPNATTNTRPSTNEQIAHEEFLIRQYEAELAEIQSRSRQRQEASSIRPATPFEDEQKDDELLNMLVNDSGSKHFDTITSADSDPVLLAQMNQLNFLITGFCCESVDRRKISQEGINLSDSAREEYTIHGYFMDNPSYGAEICLTLAATETKYRKTKTKKKLGEHPDKQVQIIFLDCKVISRASTDNKGQGASTHTDDIAWIQEEVSRHSSIDHLNVALWLDRVVSYLRFQKGRNLFLQQHAEKLSVVHQERSVVSLEIKFREAKGYTVRRNVSQSMTLIWQWSWKRNQDTLRLQEKGRPADMHPADLEELINIVGSCQETVFLLLPSSKTRTVAQAENVESDADDEGQSLDEDESVLVDSRTTARSRKRVKQSEPEHQLSEYELERLERIKRNEAYLSSLGLLDFELSMQTDSNGEKPNKR